MVTILQETNSIIVGIVTNILLKQSTLLCIIPVLITLKLNLLQGFPWKKIARIDEQ
jgi:hypothetical protein